MLRRISEPLVLSEASLVAFRPALNTPVLNVEYMPVGPARAAIVVFVEDSGGIGMALGIRSIEGGQIAVYRNRDPIEEGAAMSAVFAPALTAAEWLGFLFDEDIFEEMPEDQGRSQATALWSQLMGEVEVAAASTAVRPDETPSPAPIETTLDLDESLALESEGSDGLLEEVAVDPPVQQTLPAQTLSRFRNAEVDDEQSGPPAAAEPNPPDKPKGGGSQLGRIPLVRTRRGREGGSRVPYRARLLSSF